MAWLLVPEKLSAGVALILAASSRCSCSSNRSSTQLADGKTISSSVWRVESTRLDITDKSRFCLEGPAQFSHLTKNVVKHVYSCNCGLLAKSFGKAKCLWLMGVLMNIVEGYDNCSITCIDSFYTYLMCQPACIGKFGNPQLWKMKHLLDHFKRLCSLWRVMEECPESCQGHIYPFNSIGGISGLYTSQMQHVTMAVHKQSMWC